MNTNRFEITEQIDILIWYWMCIVKILNRQHTTKLHGVTSQTRAEFIVIILQIAQRRRNRRHLSACLSLSVGEYQRVLRERQLNSRCQPALKIAQKDVRLFCFWVGCNNGPF